MGKVIEKTQLLNKIDSSRLPNHIAIIMDGNGRWAKRFGKNRIFGHKNGVKSVREMSEACAELGVKYLTLYTFSTENWNRPKLEVYALMELLVRTISKETRTLQENNIRLNTIGDVDSLPKKSKRALLKAMKETRNNTRMTLTLALSYGSRAEIVKMTKEIAKKVKKREIKVDDINEELVSANLETKDIPDPELLIRTGGEHRISNFLLWQLAYTELHFTNKFWPDYRKPDLYKAIIDFQNRERRFGKTSEQLKK